jgi:hypothetical protein
MCLVLVDTRHNSFPGQISHHRVVEVCDIAACASNSTKLVGRLNTIVCVLTVSLRCISANRVVLFVSPELLLILFVAVIVRTERLTTEEVLPHVELLSEADLKIDLLETSLIVVIEKPIAIIVDDTHLHDALVLEEELF